MTLPLPPPLFSSPPSFKTPSSCRAQSLITCSVILICFLLLGGCKIPTDPRIGQSIQPVTSIHLDGSSFDLRSNTLKRPVVVTFFATWCPICHRQHELFRQWLDSSPKHQPVDFVVVNADDDSPDRASLVRAYLAEHQLSWNPVMASSTFVSLYQVRALPTTMVIDQSGRFRFIRVGLLSPVALDQAIRQLDQP